MTSQPSPATVERITPLLENWAGAMEPIWTFDPGVQDAGCYGAGYPHWGIQTNWNTLSALATLATQPGCREPDRWMERARQTFRHLVRSHVSGGGRSRSGEPWGHSWISVLGIERSMNGVRHLLPHLDPSEQEDLKRTFLSEADWILNDYHRGPAKGVHATKWNHEGHNDPESNLWNGCFLWRMASLYPDHPQAGDWQTKAHSFILNGVSIESDAGDQTPVAGKPLAEWHIGPSFFPHFALDHHGYLNVGYMVICVSQVAYLHFDLKISGTTPPESLHHHQKELWQTIRRMIASDGRLIRVGGDTRVRYAYCQEYLLPSLLYAADQLGDAWANDLASRQIEWIFQEAADRGDGSLYGNRLDEVRANPLYYPRLESDRAAVLASWLNYTGEVAPPPPQEADYDHASAGEWHEPEHGAMLSRSPKRFASFSWRAHGHTQALCFPPADSSMAEWSFNLCPVVRFYGDGTTKGMGHRRLIGFHSRDFPGGFVTSGRVAEGVQVTIDEGGRCTDQAETFIAFAALPDGQTCVGMHLGRTAPDKFTYTRLIKELHFNLPNDHFNGYRRRITTEEGERELTAPPLRDEEISLPSPWLSIGEDLGILRVYGEHSFHLDRKQRRRGGSYRSLQVEEICFGIDRTVTQHSPGTLLFDYGFAVVTDLSSTSLSEVQCQPIRDLPPSIRGMTIEGRDGNTYRMLANFGTESFTTTVNEAPIVLEPGQAELSLMLH